MVFLRQLHPFLSFPISLHRILENTTRSCRLFALFVFVLFLFAFRFLSLYIFFYGLAGSAVFSYPVL